MRGIAQYRTNRLESAPKPQIVKMLYQEIVRRLVIAENSMDDGDDIGVWNPHLHHVREIFLELTLALDDESAPDLCATLRNLYGWCLGELVAAGRERSPDIVRTVIDVANVLLEGWEAALEGLEG